uniref:Uncharacterized protein n=1 Tax=Anguilla anguilla TaxID=7936 RepID=A0A0E9V9Z5_ANGAN
MQCNIVSLLYTNSPLSVVSPQKFI